MPFIVVPFRLESQRLPKKILEKIKGRALCVRSMERVLDAHARLENRRDWTVLAAVDNLETQRELEKALGREQLHVLMTDPKLPSGTDRVAAAVALYAKQNSSSLSDNEIIVNIQGDMPFMSAQHTSEFLNWCQKEQPEFGTLAHTWPKNQGIQDMGHVKVILNSRNEAIYFSRFPIPYSRVPLTDHDDIVPLYHVGMYAYQWKTLQCFCNWTPHALERFEGLEQLRALANGQTIKVFAFENTDSQSSFRGIDTTDDLAWAQMHSTLS
jgi:3-deoxy-manno-octulosonate cytidylyltransferase (CMP-KDO synthetase)